MPNKIRDLTGLRHKQLTVLEPTDRRSSNGGVIWLCRCDCRKECFVASGDLTHASSTVVSCGCYRRSESSKRLKTHGMTDSPEYLIWASMRSRCVNQNRNAYPHYGGRGIRICDRLKDNFEAFYEDMGARPSEDLSIDRIDNEGHYEPSNCRWATRREQAQNRRSSRYVTFRGETKSVAEWARVLGLTRESMTNRLEKWDLERALTEEKEYGRNHVQG